MKTRLHRSSSTQGLMKPFIFSVDEPKKIVRRKKFSGCTLLQTNKNKISLQTRVVIETRFTTQGGRYV